ncbi:MAG: hypothetical protein ACREH8_00845 [Opitutaceae bacterium]
MSEPTKLSPTPRSTPVALARLAVVNGEGDRTGESITVHFNPATLQLQVSNELKDTANNERKQYIAKTSAKLTMDLPFDTTDTGTDVTLTTRKLQSFLAPPLPEGDEARQQVPPPLVLFEWGTLRFKGIAENYRETIDFFSASGVPLRASVSMTLSRQDQVFDNASGGAGATPPGAASPGTFNLDTPAGGAADAASTLDAPGAARGIAVLNGQENLRFGAGGSLSISGSVSLKASAAFSAGGAGAGIGLGGGASVGAGLSIGGGASVGAGASAGAGMSATARLSAAEGAFAGLRVSASGPGTVKLDPKKLLPRIASANHVTGAGAAFQAGGKATLSGAGGLRADVGSSGKLNFD